MCGDDAFATCSRDKTVRVWREAIGGVGFACSTVCAGHQSFVTALAYAPATNSVVSGGRDKKLIAWDPATGDAKATMAGHELDVTAVCILSDGRIAGHGSAAAACSATSRSRLKQQAWVTLIQPC